MGDHMVTGPMNVRPRLLVIATAFEPALKAGGPAVTLSNLVRRLDGDFEIDVVAPDRDLGDAEPFHGLSGRTVVRGNTTIYYLDIGSFAQVRSLVRRLAGTDYDLVMLNSIWNVRLAVAPALLHLFGTLKGPVLLMPHGELEPGALALKAAKKRLAQPLARAIYSRAVSVFGTTSSAERDHTASWFPTAQIVTSADNAPDTIDFGIPARRAPRFQLLYLSRITPNKGLLPLLRGFRLMKTACDFTIVGPIEDAAYWDDCMSEVESLPSHLRVTHSGTAARAEIATFFWNSDCFALLTAGENYGHVIAEALQAGCPVVTTSTTPWTDVLRTGGGAIIDDRDDATHVAAILDGWAEMSLQRRTDARYAARRAFERFEASTGPDVIHMAMNLLSE